MTNNWRDKLDDFLADFEHMDDAIGVLVCGSYITGGATAHSDLDVHIVLRDDVDYRERGNRIVDSLLIEYFANPPRQILAYFREDLQERSLMAQTQFATGEVLMDKSGAVAKLVGVAKRQIDDFYADGAPKAMGPLTKYGLWDMKDDLEDAAATNRTDFDFLYHNFLHRTIAAYMQHEHMPYNPKTVLGNIASEATRTKYLMRQMPDAHIAGLIADCITATGQH